MFACLTANNGNEPDAMYHVPATPAYVARASTTATATPRKLQGALLTTALVHVSLATALFAPSTFTLLGTPPPTRQHPRVCYCHHYPPDATPHVQAPFRSSAPTR